jgi:hypothetical protein
VDGEERLVVSVSYFSTLQVYKLYTVEWQND